MLTTAPMAPLAITVKMSMINHMCNIYLNFSRLKTVKLSLKIVGTAGIVGMSWLMGGCRGVCYITHACAQEEKVISESVIE